MIFSTGGYAAAPIVSAARSLRIPYVIHSADSLPAKSNRMYGREAAAFTCVFKSTASYVPNLKVTRTGHPIRRDLRTAASANREFSDSKNVLVVGGSQGSEFLNQTVPEAMVGLPDVSVHHASGPTQFAATSERVAALALPSYKVVPYLQSSEMAAAYAQADIVIARSGGTLAEIAMFGIPSILVPLPSSADDHQLHNAEEFAAMDAAILLRQASGSGHAAVATPLSIREAMANWFESEEKRQRAKHNLLGWDIPDATERIVHLIETAI